MKQQDIAMLVLITVLSLLFSFFVGNALFGGDGSRSATVQSVLPISAEFPEIDTSIFNDDAINLVETITIGETTTTSPFTSGEN